MSAKKTVKARRKRSRMVECVVSIAAAWVALWCCFFHHYLWAVPFAVIWLVGFLYLCMTRGSYERSQNAR